MKKLRDSMSDEQIRSMVLSIIEEVDSDICKMYRRETCEDDEPVTLDPLICIVKNYLFVDNQDCYLCRQRRKDWDGSESKCAFNGGFGNNWNCATLNALRHIANIHETNVKIPEVDFRYYEDQRYATINLQEMSYRGMFVGDALWMTWYKNRGRTDNVVLLSGDSESVVPTEEDCLKILRFFRDKGVNIGVEFP